MTRIPELLAPAGNLEKLKYAVAYGADAVYLGGTSFGLRTAAANFDLETLSLAVDYAHKRGVKVYVTLNIFAHNHDFKALAPYVRDLDNIGVDAVIVSDLGVLSLVRELAPQLKVHVSTQANNTNWRSVQVWESLGASRIVLARELSLGEIREIKERTAGELEVFVHGAMCISYSGRCLLSNYMTGRGANQGDCAQSCRWRYHLMEEKRPGEYFPFLEDARGTYILSSKDLCLLEYLPNLIQAGVVALKIEGRVKSIHYVATVTRVYRQALDAYRADPGRFQVLPEWLAEVGKVSNRDYTTGFLTGAQPGGQLPHVDNIYRRDYTFVGAVLGYDRVRGMLKVEQRNHFARGEQLEILMPGREIGHLRVERIEDESGCVQEMAPHPRQVVYLPYPQPLPEFSLLRRQLNNG